MQLFGCLIILAFILVFVVIAFFGSFLMWLRSLLGWPPRQRHYYQNEQQPNTSTQAKKKVFADEEGEYVPFEEIKEDNNDGGNANH